MFGIAHFLAGKCHTPDEAYRLLCELREDRTIALKSAEAGYKKQQAKIIRATRIINDPNADEVDKLEAEADILELKAVEEQQRACYEAAVNEVNFINKCIEKVVPLRKFAHLPDHLAHQAAQHEEWKYELIERTKDYLLTTGTIPHDHYRTMRLHPAFETEIQPAIADISNKIWAGKLSLANAVEVLSEYRTPMQMLLGEGKIEIQLIESPKEE